MRLTYHHGTTMIHHGLTIPATICWMLYQDISTSIHTCLDSTLISTTLAGRLRSRVKLLRRLHRRHLRLRLCNHLQHRRLRRYLHRRFRQLFHPLRVPTLPFLSTALANGRHGRRLLQRLEHRLHTLSPSRHLHLTRRQRILFGRSGMSHLRRPSLRLGEIGQKQLKPGLMSHLELRWRRETISCPISAKTPVSSAVSGHKAPVKFNGRSVPWTVPSSWH